jgi:hypothetical protein
MHKPSPAPKPGRHHLPLLLLFATSQLLAAGCQDRGPFGMDETAFAKALAAGDTQAIVGLDEAKLKNTGRGGPSTWYYVGRWLDALVPAEARGRAKTANVNPVASDEAGSPTPAGSAESQGQVPSALQDIGGGGRPVPDRSGPRFRVRELYDLAFEACTGLVQREAGLALVAATAADARAAQTAGSSSDAAALWRLVLEYSQRFGDELGPTATVRRARLDALDALEREAELVRECADYRELFPREAEGDDALLYFEGSAALSLSMKGWAPPLRGLLLERPVSAWTEKALALLRDRAQKEKGEGDGPEITQVELDAAALRAAVYERDYGQAWRSAIRAKSLVLSSKASASLVADAGKAALYSNSSLEGLGLFKTVFGDYPRDEGDLARNEAETAAAWTASYYRARFLRALERWDEATALFRLLAPLAKNDADVDAALWYGSDSAIRSYKATLDRLAKAKKPTVELTKAREAKLRRFELDRLVEASLSWKDPATFNDLADSLLRDGIAARDWLLVTDFAAKLGSRLSPLLDARAAYVTGRVLELGLDRKALEAAARVAAKKSGKPSAKPLSAQAAKAVERAELPDGGFVEDGFDGPTLAHEAVSFYLAAANRSGAPTYYRILAQRRLGLDPEILPAPGSRVGAAEPSPEETASTPELLAAAKDREAFILGFLDYGLSALALSETKTRFDDLDLGVLRRIAEALARHGDYASSMRVALSLQDKPDWRAERRDYELIYPRPYLDELRAIRPRPDVPEYILFGLLRSESFFRSDIVSSAGAIGLAQLMPATAREIAGGIGMKDYDLRKPADNLRMGAVHFGELISESGGRPLRAMFAYNAGRGRLKRWLAENEGLPDDLFLEALSYEETRQYGRNILQASWFYGMLYYEMDWKSAVDLVLGE